jgi:DNA-binding GntR family transcriptional regulator
MQIDLGDPEMPAMGDAPLSAGEPRTRAEFVADELRRMIVRGELHAGERLRQVEIAKRFSVSTTPVREAFTSLAREGLLRQDAHRGFVVFLPTRDDLRENYEIRQALEPLATALAAESATDAELDAIAELHQKMLGPVVGREGIDLNREFHIAIYTAARRPLLLQHIDRLRDSAAAYVQLLVAKHPPAYDDEVRHEHGDIVAALRSRAPDRAREAMAAHLQHSYEAISALLER